MLQKINILIFFLVISSSLTLVHGQTIPSLEELKSSKEIKLPAAKVSNGKAASRIALDAYMRKTGGLSAYEACGAIQLLELGFEIKDFAVTGDKIWEVRITDMSLGVVGLLRAILWVHAETEKVHFVCGHWNNSTSEE